MNFNAPKLTVTLLVAIVSLTVIALTAGCNGHSVAGTGAGTGAETGAETGDSPDQTFVGRVYDESGKLREPAPLPRIVRAEAEWKADLAPDRYRILRQHGTERPYTGALLKNPASGVYRCAACDLPLFTSETKFESGTGWPSFYAAIADGNVGETSDRSLGMVRTEIHCGRCAGHLGHVFPDGPAPTGLRYCVNSLSLEFTPIEEVAKLAEKLPEKKTASADVEGGPYASAVFAGGCFWCVEAVFEELEGVREAISGYAGGTAETANYEAVCTGKTKHAEAVKIIYDPEKIRYEDLLRVHFATHDPTTLNRQGNDIGPQYRSAIFYADEKEKALAGAFIEDLNDQKTYGRKRVVTTLEPAKAFYPAETYHQNYVCQNPSQGYVRGVALPKVAKVRKQFEDMLKDESPLENAGR